MTEKTYSVLGLGPKEFKELMFQMGLLDEKGNPTRVALENGLLVERIIPIPEG